MTPATPTPPPFLHRLLDELPLGVIVLDADGRVVLFNQTEQRLARRDASSVLGRSFFEEVAPCLDVAALAGVYRDRIGRQPLDVTREVSFPFPHLERPRDVVVKLRSFETEGTIYGCVFIEDVSARRAIDRTKDALTNLLVHDLKNPLTIVTTNLGLLRRASPVAERAKLSRAVSDAELGTARLHRMIMNLLDITRLESEAVPVRRDETSIASVVDAVVEGARQLAAELEIELHAETPPPAHLHRFDAELVRRALENLVDNALSYGPRHTAVWVRAIERPGGCAIEVQDQGPGVAPELRSSIFEPSVRLEASAGQHNRGLGLTLVRLVATAHGGQVTVEEPAGGGSLFRLWLPDPHPARP